MSKGLETLENILNQELIKPSKYRKTIRDIASVGQVIAIQKELEDYEETKQDLEQVMKDYQDLGNSCYKKSKALEFLKDTCNLKVYKNKFGQCFLEGTNILFPISKEEWNLLKEVLL